MIIVSPAELSSSEVERLRAFERQGHDALAKSYHAFFAPVTALARIMHYAAHFCMSGALGRVPTFRLARTV